MGPEGLTDRIRAIEPLLADNAALAEELRQPVDTVWEAICATGVLKSFVPRHFGGYELGLQDFMEIGVTLGRGCVSTAWVTTFCMEHNWLLAQFGEQAQQEIFGRQPYIVAPGAISPNGHATPEAGGYSLSGRWQWGTGVMHADWVLLAGVVHEPEGTGLRMFVLPIDEVEVIDTWQIDGMVGTGSNDMEVANVHVPEHRSVSVNAMSQGRGPGALWHDSHLFRIPMLPFKAITAACPAVGAAQRAVGLFRARLEERVMWGTGITQKDHAPAQMRLGLLDVRAHAVEQQIHHLAQEIEDWGTRDGPCPTVDRARLRLHAAVVVRECRDIVRDVVEASGASSHLLANPLQRIHRDVHTLAGHMVFDVDVASSNYGRAMLGFEIAGLV
jgi:alkylation response protein AidB-like acyl-CoA dehydrogenase